MQSEEILRPLDDITVRGGVCNWYEVANAIFEVRRRLEAALSAAEPSVAVKRIEYTTAIGEAAQGYFNSFGSFKVHTPGTFLFSELWDVMQSAALTAQVQDVAGTVEMVENCVLFSTPGEYAGLADHAAFEAGQDNAIRTVVKLLRDNLPAAPAKQEGKP